MWNRVSGKFNWIHIKPVMIFAMTLVPTTLANLILSISDRYFINSFWDLTTVGVYGLTYKIGSGVSMLIAMPFVTAWPALIFSEKDSNKIGEFVSKAAFSLWMIGMFFVVIGSTSAKPLLLLFGGNRFLPGANLIPLISLGGLLFGVTGLIMTSIVATGLLHWNMITMLAVSGVNLIFNILLIPTYGMIGAALSTIFSYTVGFFISIVLAQKIIPLKVDILKWTKIIVGGLIALFCGRLFTEISHYQMLNIFAATSIAAGVYVLSLTLFRLLPAAFYDPALIRRGCFSFIRSNKTSNNDSL
jgi:O-antigen/teichoic acid export membrane protein